MITGLVRRRTFVEWTLQAEITVRWFWRLVVSAGTENVSLGLVVQRPMPLAERWRIALGFGFGVLAFELWPPNADRDEGAGDWQDDLGCEPESACGEEPTP